MRKSKAVIMAAGIIWALVSYQYAQAGLLGHAEEAVHQFLLEFSELFLFLLTAMTYVNSMSERNVARSAVMLVPFGITCLQTVILLIIT